MNALIRGEFFLLMLAGALFTLAALHFSGNFDAVREARNFFS
jgi:hypothetical protein